jgi:CRP/FNR family transcriptional regulator, cyclic AMP receptor protein
MQLTSAAAKVASGEPAFEDESFAALLEPQDWSALQLMGRLRACPRGSALIYQGERDKQLMVLLEGRVKVTRASRDGPEILLSIRGPGEILGELPWLDGEPRLTSVIALEPAQALVIDPRAFQRYLESSPPVMLALLEVFSHRWRDAVLKRAEFPASDTTGRLCSRLVELADRYGERSEECTVIGLPLSQEELGAWVGASHAGVAKALQVLRELGWITTKRRRITVHDLQALRTRSAHLSHVPPKNA